MQFILQLPGQLLFMQCVSGLILSAVIALINAHNGFSFFIGALCILIANAILTWRFAKSAEALDPMKAVRALFGGELFKFLILAILLILVYHFLALSWVYFFAGLVFTHFGGLLALLLKRGRS